MQPLDAGREARPCDGDEKNEAHCPNHQPRTRKAEQIVEIGANHRDADADKRDPDDRIDQNCQPVFAAVDTAAKTEKQCHPVHESPF
jgi:hypothetical protein